MRVAELRTSNRNPRTISASRLEDLKRSLEADRAYLEAPAARERLPGGRTSTAPMDAYRKPERNEPVGCRHQRDPGAGGWCIQAGA